MSVIEQKAKAVASEIQGQKVVVPILLIFGIIGVIASLMTIYNYCKKQPSEVLDSIRNPNRFERLRLRRQIRNRFGNDVDSKEVMQAIIKVGQNVTLEEVEAMTKEAPAYKDY